MREIKSLYSAHTFSEREFVRDKLCIFLHKIGIRTINPFYNEEGIATRPEVIMADALQSKNIDPTRDSKWWKMVKAQSTIIVKRDLEYIDQCDGIVAYMQEWSGGTTCEIFYTGYVHHKPVFLITGNSKIFNHPWMQQSCLHGGKIFKSYLTFKRFMKKKYGKK